MNIFVFDIETVPDTATGSKLLNLKNLADTDIAEAMFAGQREKTGNDFLKHHLHKIVAISVVLKESNRLSVWSLGDPESSEKELLERFYHGLNKYAPTLVSWNGSGFDCPVIHYRSLYHKISAPRYWETGNNDNSFRWNNYLNRYHDRHLDLMDVLAGYQGRACASLESIATMLGFPGKMGMSGAQVWEYYQNGDIRAIRNYCETDVLNTYLVYLRFELLRGNINEQEYDKSYQEVCETLQGSSEEHLHQFLSLLKKP